MKLKSYPKHDQPKEDYPRHIIIKLSKIKDRERILKATKDKQLVTDKGTSIRLLADFLAENLGG